MKVAYILGSRANAWHTDVLSSLPGSVEPTVVATTGNRYRLDDIRQPVRLLRWQRETKPWLQRKLASLFDRVVGSDQVPALAADKTTLADFDVLHTWELFTPWSALALDERQRRGVPLVVTVWDNIAGHFADHPQRGPIRARCLAQADRFLVVTERSRQALLLDGVETERIVRADPSVDVEAFAPSPDTQDILSYLRISDTSTVVLCVARLEPSKGVRHLIDAVALAGRDGADLALVVAGSGPERVSLERHAAIVRCADRCHFVGDGAFADMPTLYRAADLFVLPSVPTPDWQEQWGQSLVEAMASGLACIASDSGGIGETLGDAGVLVPPADPGSLAAALSRLSADAALRAELGKLARARVGDRFTHRQHANVLAALYASLVDHRNH